MIRRSIGAIAAVCLIALTAGCADTTCAAVDAAHDVFLAEVAADPTAYSPTMIRNERLSYAAASAACMAFARNNPVAK